ncbi:UDP-glucoronosyl and UDP-glucosyl transferase family protein [Aureobasidium sp. EXF-8845]|nr:UDP-glucoronosyl and UDP-glucosyl transferase family protein [Aureobasidium sp. EXF-8845]KAI4851951.1 UDP-glucoronosyl and UDP-glucosyl transferase family protein [Aureobasidium sp. EXF-8846]
MEKRRSILFVTNSELGQASVILAVAHELLLRPGYKVHIASFPALQTEVEELNATTARLSNGACSTARFHCLAGKSMKEVAPPGTEFLDLHAPGMAGALFAYDSVLPATFAPWHGTEYMIGYGSTTEIIDETSPELVIIDPLFSQGVDALVELCGNFLQLNAWLQQGPTVLINLGSHIVADQRLASEFATGIKMLLDRRPDVQVLWKLKTKDGLGDALHIITNEIEQKRVCIEPWLLAQPIAILMTGNIVCMVHHGGSNSYHEAIFAGVPQVVLPVWIDTYDFAIRVEYLGIGVWGNRVAAPHAEGLELGQALVKVVDGDNSAAILEKARQIAVPFQNGPGRHVAYEKVVDVLNA